jgi:hypothetical protein
VLAAIACPTATPMPGVFESFGVHTLPSCKTPTGPAASGFALSLSADAPEFKTGSPIWVTVELRPVSDQGTNVWYGSRHSAYTFNITSQPSAAVVPAAPNGFGLATISDPACGRPVPEGDSIFGRFRLDEMYALTRPGTYSVTVLGTPIIKCTPVPIQSNTITITILTP